MMQFLTRRSPGWAVLVILLWAASVVAQTNNFKHGEFSFKRGKAAHTVPMSPLGGSLQKTPGGNRALTLTYISAAGYVAIALAGITGPGKIANPNITSFAVQVGDFEWLFRPGEHDCTFVLSRVEAARVEGTVSCTAARGTVPWSDGKFRALP